MLEFTSDLFNKNGKECLKEDVQMKKLLAFALLSVLLMTFVGCENSGEYIIEGTVTEVGDGTVTVSTADGISYLVKLTKNTVCEIDGKKAPYSDIKVGSSVVVTYDGVATRSIPAQITASKIVSSTEPLASVTMTATVIAVDGGMLRVDVVESEYTYGEHVVHVSDATPILSANGSLIALSDISVGDTVEITYGGQVMLSYPPQIVAKRIQVRQ
jgi:hypothetical protein